MASVRANDLRANLVDVSRSIPEPEWDFLVYCRFLAQRLPETEEIQAAEFGRLAEELIADLREGVDLRTGETFVPPLVNGRSDLLYNFIRTKLRIVAEKVGGAEFAATVAAVAAPVATVATPPAAASADATAPPATPAAATPAPATGAAANPTESDTPAASSSSTV